MVPAYWSRRPWKKYGIIGLVLFVCYMVLRWDSNDSQLDALTQDIKLDEEAIELHLKLAKVVQYVTYEPPKKELLDAETEEQLR